MDPRRASLRTSPPFLSAAVLTVRLPPLATLASPAPTARAALMVRQVRVRAVCVRARARVCA